MSDRVKQASDGGLFGVGRLVSRLEALFVFPEGRGRLVRPRYPRKIAGVCSGVAEHLGWDATFLRILFVVFSIASSGGLVLAYAVAWVLIPEGAYELTGRTGMTAS